MSYVEPEVGLEKLAGESQSDKPCDKCLYFERDLSYDEPCGRCYESADKFNWTEDDGNSGSREVEPTNFRVCETCTG